MGISINLTERGLLISWSILNYLCFSCLTVKQHFPLVCGCFANGTTNQPGYDFLECIRDEVTAKSFPGKVEV